MRTPPSSTQACSFGRRVRALRLRRGATQRQLADLSTISVRAIRDIETGRVQQPRPETVTLIADGLGLTGRSRAEFERLARPAGGGGEAPNRVSAVLGPPTGRDRELAELAELIVVGGQRLVSVVGVAGVGKSELAAHVADLVGQDHPGRDGSIDVGWVSCAGAHDVVEAVEELVAARLGRLVVVLDGWTREAAAPAELLSLLGAVPDLQLLVTASTPLEVPGECVRPLTGLAGPAVALLLQELRQLRPRTEPSPAEMALLAEASRLLDGVPAALRAAGAWLPALDPAGLLDQLLDDPFVVVGDAVPRAARSGPSPEQALVAALADQPRTWTVEQARASVGGCVQSFHRALRSLMLRGLVVRDEGDELRPRFRVLELVRAAARRGLLRPTPTTRARPGVVGRQLVTA